MENRKKNRLILIAALAFLTAPVGAEKLNRIQLAMGTLLHVELEGTNPAELDLASNAIFKEVQKLDHMLSNYKPTSEVSRINRAASSGPVQVSDEMIRFLMSSDRLSYLSDGFFDITVEPLTQLWHLRDGRLDKFPTEDEIKSAAKKVNSNNVEISFHNNTVRFTEPGMGIDTGGIGKGYALDSCVAKLSGYPTLVSATLNFGGEILYWAREPRDHTFFVKNPRNPTAIWESFSISSFSAVLGLSTSANYERFVRTSSTSANYTYADGKISHILNPRTGMPARNEILSVSVVSMTGAEADALSTAIFGMGLDLGMAFSDQLENSAVLILYDRFGKIESFKSQNWVKYVNSQI